MAEHENILLRKIGPLPAIAWSGIIAGVYVAYKWATVKRQPTQSSTEPASEIPTYPADGTSGDPGYGNATGSYAGGSTATPPYSEPTIPDNTTWAKRAINWLIAQGIDPGVANTAITSFIYQDGTLLNESQYAAWQEAFNHFGSPPEALPSPTAPMPTTAVNPAPSVPPPSTNPTTTPAGKAPYQDVFGYDPQRPGTTTGRVTPPPAGFSCPPGSQPGFNTVTGQWTCVQGP